MPTPRDQGMKHQSLGGEPKYCGQCGLPGAMCQCSQYKEWGSTGAVKAGSALGDDPNQMKNGNGGTPPTTKAPAGVPETEAEEEE